MYKSIILPLAKEDIRKLPNGTTKRARGLVKGLRQKPGRKSVLSGKTPWLPTFVSIM
jgi:hypothetical protein